MKWITLFFLFFLTNAMFSQLSVSGANYVFATTNSSSSTDVFLFVEDDVNLSDPTSYLYLRADAQLLQGKGTTGNSGIGQLSTYQSGTVNNYAYNYWCSPVGNIDVDSFGNRKFRADNQLYTPSSISNSNLATYTSGYDGSYSGTSLVISNYWLNSFYSGVTYNNWSYIGSVGELDAGYGFTMKGTNAGNQLYDFRGKPNNGTMVTAVKTDNFTLVGNPYPSAIDAHAYIWDTDNLANLKATLYYWEQDPTVNSHVLADYVGGYATYTITADGNVTTTVRATYDRYTYDGFDTTAIPGSPSTSAKKMNRNIPVGQGFIIDGSGTGNVYMKNSFRVYEKKSGTNSTFFKTSKPKSRTTASAVSTNAEYTAAGFNFVPEPYQRFRLGVDFNNVYTRQLVQTFHESATDGYDRGLESESALISNDAYWVLDDYSYAAQAFKFSESLAIPLVVDIQKSQPIQIRIFDIQNFSDSQAIYIHDKLDNTYTNLRTQNFQVSLDAGNYTDRFTVVFVSENSLGTKEDILAQGIFVFMKNSDSEIQIKNNTNADLLDVKLFNTLGQLQHTWNTGLQGSDIVKLPVNKFSSGMYIVKLNTSDGIVSKKVIIQ